MVGGVPRRGEQVGSEHNLALWNRLCDEVDVFGLERRGDQDVETRIAETHVGQDLQGVWGCGLCSVVASDQVLSGYRKQVGVH